MSEKTKRKDRSKMSKLRKILKKIALLLLPSHQEIILSKPYLVKNRRKHKMSSRILTIATIRKAIIIEIILELKTSYSLGNLYTSHCKYQSEYQGLNRFITYALYLVFDLFLRLQRLNID